MNDQTLPLPAIWFPTIRAGTGTDAFTIRLAEALNRRGIRAEITWLPHRSEYAPWTVTPPTPPSWANVVHINSWLHRRFIPPKLPLVVTLHGCVHDPALAPYKSVPRTLYHQLWVKACEAYSIRRAAAVTAVSHYTATQAAGIFGCSAILPIHNWIDLQCYSPDQRKTPQHPFRLLFVGKPSRRKGTDLLPEIMRRLGKDFELHYTAHANDLSDSAKLPANMIPIGRLNGDAALIDAYRNCDALLFPTRLEGLSLVTLEAQACGRPVIATDGSSLPEVVIQNRTGILCPVDSIDDFVAAARRLRDQPAVWQRMSTAARERAAAAFRERQIHRCLYRGLF